MRDLITPSFAEINLDNLKYNIDRIKQIINRDTLFMAVIKADAYGHGAIEVTRVCINNGINRFSVATLSEAIELRKVYPHIEILILGYTPKELTEYLIDYNITQSVHSLEQAEYFNKVAESKNKKLKVHINIDTGMHRLGFQCTEQSVDSIEEIYNMQGIEIEGIFTHFATADISDKSYTIEQANKFSNMVYRLKKRSVYIPIKHVSNSAATMDLPELDYDMVRVGIILYGLYPSDEVKKELIDLREVMSLKTRISNVKRMDENLSIGYGRKYITDKKTNIATIPIGYADGFSRLYSSKAKCIVKGVKKNIVGNICMDQCMVDIDDIEVRVGDEVTLIGTEKGEVISIDEVAAYVGTINYEIVCTLGRRVPRVYIENGKKVSIRNYITKI